MSVEAVVQGLAARFGLHVTRARNHIDAQRQVVLERLRIDTVLDAGANVGDYGLVLRGAGFGGRIVSFEPLAAPFATLKARAAADAQWTAHQVALGRMDKQERMFRSANTVSSSMLQISDDMARAAPDTAVVGEETISLRRLDSLRAEVLPASARALLKLDVQGYEGEALAGASETLAQIAAIECELSLVPVYTGQPLAWQLLGELAARGFRPVWMERGVTDPERGWILQMDALLVRHDLA